MYIFTIAICKHIINYICKMIERIRKLILSKNLNAAQFADQIGVQRSSISHVLSGRNNPSLEFIQKILNTFPDIASDWLISGIGEIDQKSELKSTSLFEIDKVDDPLSENIGKMRPRDLKKDYGQKKPEDLTVLADNKSIERVIIFYKDGKFKEYTP